MISTPPNLIREIAHKRVVFFLGSGISANSEATSPTTQIKNPLTWGDFIKGVKALVPEDKPAMKYIDSMIQKEDYLKALQAIKNNCDSGQYNDFLRQNFDEPHFSPNKIHDYIKDINCKIVVTTNFDKIYEQCCGSQGYPVVNYYDPISKLISNLRSSQNLIIKAHGTIDDVNNIIFTDNEFFMARRENIDFYNVLKALFLTHTVVFLGYSLNDPDINLQLELTNRTKVESNPHYIFMSKGVDEELKKQWKECYNVNIFEYGDNYLDLEPYMHQLALEVDLYKVQNQLPK
ncbi:SIR2 family protein [Lysinibacillus sp. G4S2]|uniref:SIR2 family protein n=1 Tax=Lysinibacillus sp. G4S2 TaxID=3055859 RepID=UPI0025A04143|nr:SIR2 family protein [Lysinibacillus sp. G4S2]MDM5251014.1 SIR2 family protein [Lysinibacillus sp. G4S2]